jgi:hypothetical protein
VGDRHQCRESGAPLIADCPRYARMKEPRLMPGPVRFRARKYRLEGREVRGCDPNSCQDSGRRVHTGGKSNSSSSGENS